MKNPSSSTTTAASAAKKTTPCCSKIGIKRGPWTPEEDELLAKYIKKEGEGRWRTLPKRAGLLRCGKSCRLRWMNYLRPCVKRGRIAPDEEDLILRLHRLLGNRWSLIAGRIPGRTDNEIKNYWNTHLSKKLISQGIDPRTHKPLNPNPKSEIDGVHDPNRIISYNPTTSFHQLEETSRPYRVIATKVSQNFTMLHMDRDQYHQSQQFVNHQDQYGSENLPINACDGFLMAASQDDNEQNNVEDYNVVGSGLNEDTFSSFLDSLINDNVFGTQQVLLQPNMAAAPSLINNNPAGFSSAQTFNPMWEAEVFPPMAALGEEDGACFK